MATDTATTNSEGVVNMAIGSFTGAGADVDVTLGFKPRLLKVINITDRTTYEITSDMVATKALKTVAEGTMTDDTAGILLRDGQSSAGYRGFLVPAAIEINAKVLQWIAFG